MREGPGVEFRHERLSLRLAGLLAVLIPLSALALIVGAAAVGGGHGSYVLWWSSACAGGPGSRGDFLALRLADAGDQSEVQINVDTLSSGRWCTIIDLVALVLPIDLPAAVTLEPTGANGIRERSYAPTRSTCWCEIRRRSHSSTR